MMIQMTILISVILRLMQTKIVLPDNYQDIRQDDSEIVADMMTNINTGWHSSGLDSVHISIISTLLAYQTIKTIISNH